MYSVSPILEGWLWGLVIGASQAASPIRIVARPFFYRRHLGRLPAQYVLIILTYNYNYNHKTTYKNKIQI